MGVGLGINNLAKHIGVEVTGVDLSRPLADVDFARILELFHERSVLVFPRQHITPTQQLAFTQLFGEVELHPMVEYTVPRCPEVLIVSNMFHDGKPIGLYDGDDIEWHVDQAPTPRPCLATLLYCIQAAEVGGDTLFASSAAAYEKLDSETKERVDGLRAVHSMVYFYEQMLENRPSAESKRIGPDVIHALVRTHPITGRRSLFVGSKTIRAVVGLNEQEGRALIDGLLKHATKEEFVYRHKWRDGDLVCWDNRSVIHTPTPCDRQKYHRLLHRTTVRGEVIGELVA
jgi:taurine dioxygenase